MTGLGDLVFADFVGLGVRVLEPVGSSRGSRAALLMLCRRFGFTQASVSWDFDFRFLPRAESSSSLCRRFLSPFTTAVSGDDLARKALPTSPGSDPTMVGEL